MKNFLRRLRDCTSGAALMETAIVFPLVLTLMFGVLDIARAIQDYHTADKSMRSAARYLARVPAEATCDGAWGWKNAQNLAMYGTINPATEKDSTTEEVRIVARPVIVGWTDKNTLTRDRKPECPDEPTTIAIIADVPIETPLISAIGFNSHLHVVVRHEERHIGG